MITEKQKEIIRKEAFNGFRNPDFRFDKFLNNKAKVLGMKPQEINRIFGEAVKLNLPREKDDPRTNQIRFKFRNKFYKVNKKYLMPTE